MDNRNSSRAQRQAQLQKQAERRKYMRIQQGIRAGAILLALLLAIIALANSCSTKKAIEDLAAQLRAKKLAQAQEEILAQQQESPSPTPSEEPEAPAGVQVTLSFVGEVSLGDDDNLSGGDLFSQYCDSYGASYFFQNVKSLFEGDDLTAASLYGTLTLTSDPTLRENWNMAFLAQPEAAAVLSSGGIDMVDAANAHSYDFGDSGYVDTLANLDIAGLGRFGFGYVQTRAVGDVTVGFTGVWEGSEEDYQQQALNNIASLKSAGAQLIVVMVSWTSGDENLPDDRQILMAHTLVDAGADLVVGIQPEVLQGVERYHGRCIAYSLGTFLSCDPDPDATDALILKQTFTVSGGKCQDDPALELIPCTISGASSNNLCPEPLTGEEKQRVMDLIYDRSGLLDGGIYPES